MSQRTCTVLIRKMALLSHVNWLKVVLLAIQMCRDTFLYNHMALARAHGKGCSTSSNVTLLQVLNDITTWCSKFLYRLYPICCCFHWISLYGEIIPVYLFNCFNVYMERREQNSRNEIKCQDPKLQVLHTIL